MALRPTSAATENVKHGLGLSAYRRKDRGDWQNWRAKCSSRTLIPGLADHAAKPISDLFFDERAQAAIQDPHIVRDSAAAMPSS